MINCRKLIYYLHHITYFKNLKDLYLLKMYRWPTFLGSLLTTELKGLFLTVMNQIWLAFFSCLLNPIISSLNKPQWQSDLDFQPIHVCTFRNVSHVGFYFVDDEYVATKHTLISNIYMLHLKGESLSKIFPDILCYTWPSARKN